MKKSANFPKALSQISRVSRIEDANYIGAALHFIVEPLERIGAVQFAAALLGGVEIISAALPRCRRVRLGGAALPIRDRNRLAY